MREKEASFCIYTEPDNVQIFFEIELKYPKRFLHIGRRSRYSNEGHDNIAFFYMVLNPFLIDRNITFNKMKTFMAMTGIKLIVS